MRIPIPLVRVFIAGAMPERWAVWFCLAAHTDEFKQGVAIVLEQGVSRPLTSADIMQVTGLDRGHVRRALAELERFGFIRRVAAEEQRGLVRGNIWIEVFGCRKPAPPSVPMSDATAAMLAGWSKERASTAPPDPSV